MKRFGVIWSLALVCGLTLAADDPGRGVSLSLIRIPKTGPAATRVLARLGTDVRQELATCYLALADVRELDALRRSGIGFRVLDRGPANRKLFLVGLSGPGDLARLQAAGRAVAVEPGTAVFRPLTGGLEALPAELPRKALPARSVLPFIQTRPFAAAPTAEASAADPFIGSIVSAVSGPSLAAGVQTLQDFQTRYASTANCEAAGDSLFAAFAALGLDDVQFDPFTFGGSYASRNVIADKTGQTYPDYVYIVCSHYDSTSPSRLTSAPGADDNASGTAAVLEAARVLAPYAFDYTLRFIAFSAEEWGLYGSRDYAGWARGAGRRILGVINLDMIAYANAAPEDLQVFVNGASGWLGDLFAAAGPLYGPVDAVKIVDPSVIYSDHSPFWDNGYPALLAIEDLPLTNPYYHQTTDTLDKLDLDFFTRSTRAAVGLAAELAQPIKPGYPRTPVGLIGSTEYYRSLFHAVAAVRLSWTPQVDAVGYNVYRSDTPHIGYVKINAAPVAEASFTDSPIEPGRPYYYAVTAVGPTGLESNRSLDNDWLSHPAGFSIEAGPVVLPITLWSLRGLR